MAFFAPKFVREGSQEVARRNRHRSGLVFENLETRRILAGFSSMGSLLSSRLSLLRDASKHVATLAPAPAAPAKPAIAGALNIPLSAVSNTTAPKPVTTPAPAPAAPAKPVNIHALSIPRFW